MLKKISREVCVFTPHLGVARIMPVSQVSSEYYRMAKIIEELREFAIKHNVCIITTRALTDEEKAQLLDKYNSLIPLYETEPPSDIVLGFINGDERAETRIFINSPRV